MKPWHVRITAPCLQVASELQQFLGSSQIPSFTSYAQKLQNVRHRIATTNATLQQVQARLTRLDKLAERLQAAEHLTLRQLPQDSQQNSSSSL